MSDARPLPPSMGGPRHTPEAGLDVVVRATSAQAVPPELVAHLKVGILPEEGIPPEEGVPPEEGIAPELGVLPGSEGQLDPGDAVLPGALGQVDPGAPGQVDRGAPGQMDPWAENPWAKEEIGFDAGAEEEAIAEAWPEESPPAEEDYGAFFAQQPNFLDLPEIRAGGDASAPDDDEPAGS